MSVVNNVTEGCIVEENGLLIHYSDGLPQMLHAEVSQVYTVYPDCPARWAVKALNQLDDCRFSAT